jgi:phosphatidylglycerol---prolipoprotein diacylglyceryl transferase
MVASIIWNVKPQIADLGFIELRWYSLLFLIGFIIGYYVLLKVFKREGISIELLDKLTFYVVISTIIGARLGHCLFYEPEVYLKHPLRMILPFEGTPGKDFHFTGYQGLASHGGAIGLLIGLYLFARNSKLPYLWVLDRIALVTAQAGCLIRLGNLFNSEIVGTATSLPWGVKFVQLAPKGMPVERIIPLHPSQIYESICYLIIFVILMTIYFRKHPNLKPGFLIGLFFILVFTCRFFIEFLKENQVDFEAGMILNMGQILSIPFIIAGFILVFRKVKSA